MNKTTLTHAFAKVLPLFIMAALLVTPAGGGPNVAAAPQGQDEVACDPAKLEELGAELREARVALAEDCSSEAAQAAYEAAVADHEAYAKVCDEAQRAKSEPSVAPALLATGGPDAFGYTYKDSAEPDGPAYQWIEISATGTDMGLGDDDYFWPIDLPWDFDFYDTLYNQVAVGSNGTVYFMDWYLGLSNSCLPGANPYDVPTFIAGYWDDLDCGPGAVYYEIQGTPGSRMLIVEWDNVPHYGSTDPLTYEVILFEGTNSILVQYLDASSELGGSGTVGIQGDVTTGLEYSCDTPALQDSLAICFAYPGQSPDCGLQKTLTVNKAGAGTGTVTSDPAGINCGGDCTETYDIDTIVTLTATPDEGSVFAGWSGDCSGTDSTTTVTMDEDKTCTATFSLKPRLVGGVIVPVSRVELLAPWLGLAALMAVAVAAVAIKRRRT